MFSRPHLPFQIFTVLFILAMFLPRVLPEGMFADALTYTSIARNIAIGKGSFWQPYFSSGFWIPFEGSTYAFYGHPPLVMGLMSVFFKILGENWFTEKAYCIVIWLLNLYLVYKIWQFQAKERALWWLPLIVWYGMPIVLWCYPNAMLDNTMTVFTLSAALLILKGLQAEKFPYTLYIGAGLCLHLALMSKGPVGVYPLAIPFIYAFFYENKYTARETMLQTLVIAVSCIGTLMLWALYEPARIYWMKYFNVQLVSSLAENDQTEHWTWLNYLNVIPSLLMQCAPPLAVGLIFFIFSKIKKAPFIFETDNTRLAKFYLAIALAGSLPMMVSHKMDTFYLIPAIPFLSLSFSSLFEPTLMDWVKRFRLSKLKAQRVNGFLIITLIGVLIYSANEFGKVGREQDVINDIKILRGYIPQGAKIGVTETSMGEFTIHAYLQRYEKWELTRLSEKPKYFLINNRFPTDIDSIVKLKIYKELKIKELQRFRFFKNIQETE